ncbi:MAG: amylo-alpha-1,6-glucosidase [Polyangiaceae bacterium]
MPSNGEACFRSSSRRSTTSAVQPLPPRHCSSSRQCAKWPRGISFDDPLIRRTAYPALVRAFVRLQSSRFRRIAWTTEEGLIANYDPHRPLTWMNGRVGNWIVTPRRGAAIELQALWSRGCETLARLADHYGNVELKERAEAACRKARAAVQKRFWCKDTDYPYDCVSELPEGDAAFHDSSIRPNALMALVLDPALFEPWQAEAILARVRQDLLTPRGLRTLAPQERGYQGYHEGGLEEREGSAHQGTVWPHLLGYYVRAQVRMAPEDDELRKQLRDLVEAAIDEPLALCQVAGNGRRGAAESIPSVPGQRLGGC